MELMQIDVINVLDSVEDKKFAHAQLIIAMELHQ
jgi:hypothetical protein